MKATRVACGLVLAGCLGLSALGCSKEEETPGTPAPASTVGTGSAILKMRMAADGKMTLEGKPATLEEMDKALTELGKQKGTLVYYREPVNDTFNDPFRNVAPLLIKHQVIGRLSGKPDLSDLLGPDGKLKAD